MRRLALLSSTIMVSLCVLIGFAISLGRQQPLPESVALLHLSDCELPCWIGIIPGQTTMRQAHDQIIKTYGGQRNYALIKDDSTSTLLSFSVVSNYSGTERLHIICQSLADRVHRCDLTWRNYRFAPQIAYVAEIIKDSLEVKWLERGIIGWFYHNKKQYAVIGFQPDFTLLNPRFTPIIRVRTIQFVYRESPLSTDDNMIWHGFSDIRRYLLK
jgi:hypothetical protein